MPVRRWDVRTARIRRCWRRARGAKHPHCISILPPHRTHALESKQVALCVCGIRCIVKRAYGVKYTLVPSAVAPPYLRPNKEARANVAPVSDTHGLGVATVEKAEVVVSSSPMLFWRWGAKKTRVPSAAAPWYFMTEPVLKPAVRMVEKVDVVTSSTPTAQRRVGGAGA